MSHKSNWADRHGAARTVPMKVLILGFCRTGTASMRTALKTLGYNETHHMQTVIENPIDADMWREAIDAKFFGEGKPYGREQWDQLLGHCQAVTDLPAILFADELLVAYPDAKVVLTMRDPEKWWKSYNETLGATWNNKSARVAEWLDPHHFGKVMQLARLSIQMALRCDSTGAREADAKARFVEHYEHVRRLVPKERLLEYRVGEGWQRLCAFLGNDVPAVDFPRTNDTQMILKRVETWTWEIYRRTALRVFLPITALAFIGIAIYTATC